MEERTLCKQLLSLFSGAAAAACNCQLSLINSYILRGQERKFFVTDSNKNIIHLIIHKHVCLYLKSLLSCIHSISHTQTGRSSYSSEQGHNPNEHYSTAQQHSVQLNVLCPAGHGTGAHSNANNIFSTRTLPF